VLPEKTVPSRRHKPRRANPTTQMEFPMNAKYLATALMSVGLLLAAPAFAQSPMAQKQHTQEGGSTAPEECSLPYNADPAADPDCRQHTQNLIPSPLQADADGTRK
jgi:hypothetical protein